MGKLPVVDQRPGRGEGVPEHGIVANARTNVGELLAAVTKITISFEKSTTVLLTPFLNRAMMRCSCLLDLRRLRLGVH